MTCEKCGIEQTDVAEWGDKPICEGCVWANDGYDMDSVVSFEDTSAREARIKEDARA